MTNHADIIIVNYNTSAHLEKCIQTIEKNTHYPHRLIIIDNASTDNSRAVLKRYQAEGLTVIYNQQNLGTSKAWNQGIRTGSGQYIVIMNPDTQVTPGWLTQMVKCAESSEHIAIVGNKQVNQGGIILHAGVVSVNGRDLIRGIGEPDAPNKFNTPCDCLAICGACFLIKREVLPRLGYFDERFFMYAEESDYCYRARILGYRILYCPVTVIHFTEGSPMDKGRRNTIHQQSITYFRQKWPGPFTLRQKLASPQVLRTARLIKSATRSEVYLLYESKRYWIPNPDILQRLGLTRDRIEVLPQAAVNAIPLGFTIWI